MQSVIYLDHNATTPVDQNVLEAMIPYFSLNYGNPSSSLHPQSWATAGAVKNARLQVAELIGAKDPSEIIFTSGATESINLALKGLLLKNKELTLITSNIEHSATAEVAAWALQNNLKVIFLNVKKNGLIDLSDLEGCLSETQGPKLVSLILAHNEIGSLYNLKAVGELKDKYEFILHWDATQALLTEPVHEAIDSFDMLSLSAHKLYGPKGVGALYLKKTTVGHQLQPLISGGEQEFGLRSGTLNVPGIVGLAEACRIVQNRRAEDLSHFKTLSQNFKNLLHKNLIVATFNGDPESRIFQNISLTLPGSFTNMDLMSHFNGFCLSQGSACGSLKMKSNPVLSAIGLSESQMTRTIRIGLGRNTTEEDLEKFVDRLANRV